MIHLYLRSDSLDRSKGTFYYPFIKDYVSRCLPLSTCLLRLPSRDSTCLRRRRFRLRDTPVSTLPHPSVRSFDSPLDPKLTRPKVSTTSPKTLIRVSFTFGNFENPSSHHTALDLNIGPQKLLTQTPPLLLSSSPKTQSGSLGSSWGYVPLVVDLRPHGVFSQANPLLGHVTVVAGVQASEEIATLTGPVPIFHSF